MNNTHGICPKCGKQIELAEIPEAFHCIHCGKPITKDSILYIHFEKHPNEDVLLERHKNNEDVSDLITQILADDPYNSSANKLFVLAHFKDIYYNYPDAMDHFKIDKYKAYFEKYKEETRPIFTALEHYVLSDPQNGQGFMQNIVKELMADIFNYIESEKRKYHHDSRKEKCAFLIAGYLTPMIQEQQLIISEALSDLFIEEWNQLYPDMPIQKGNYKELAEGFRKRKWCFITTAVCNSLGKPDDCYELNLFRKYRDEYLLTNEADALLVDEYYHVAPSIVACINLLKDSDEIYSHILEEWLYPCQKYIENQEYEKCKEHYVNMVRTLEKQYFN